MPISRYSLRTLDIVYWLIFASPFVALRGHASSCLESLLYEI